MAASQRCRYGTAPTTKPLWQAFFPSTTEQEWNAQMTAANPNAFANEVSCALLAKAYDRPVAIVGGGGQIFVTWVGAEVRVTWDDMIVVRLRDEHYSPMIQDVTVAMVRAMAGVKQLGHTVSLLGTVQTHYLECGWSGYPLA